MKLFVKGSILLIVIGLCSGNLQKVYAQKPEIRVALNSGLYSFRGSGTVQESALNVNSSLGAVYTNNPYGRNREISYGISGNLKFVASKFVFGLDLGYEVLRSKVGINAVYGDRGVTTDASGKAILSQGFVNIFPFAGYQLKGKLVSIDLIGGLDLAYCTSVREKANATSNGTVYTSSVDRKVEDFDYRPRVQAGINYQKFGAYAGYSFGLINYRRGLLGGPITFAQTSYIRFGISYQLL
jgi:hypothetical protein